MPNLTKFKPILPVLRSNTSLIKRSSTHPIHTLLPQKGNFGYQLPSNAIHSTLVQKCNFSPAIGANATISNSLLELEHQLSEVKIFQDEQIIQFSFKSGKSINYTMSWLRYQCSCMKCANKKIAPEDNGNYSHSVPAENKSLNVSRIRCDPGSRVFRIEWLEDNYRIHNSTYDLKELSIYYNNFIK